MNAVVAARMDRRITFQTFTEAADSYGFPAKTWADLASVPTVWAEVTPQAGEERQASEQIAAASLTTFQIRYRSDLSVEMRIVYASENYDIQSISEIGRQEGLLIVAEKVQT